MILVDSRIGSIELQPHIRRLSVPCDAGPLEYGDACFEGNGPNNKRILVGFERKTLHDMLHCIDDARYIGQRDGMLNQGDGKGGMYDLSFLILEGLWRPKEDGTLMEGFRGGTAWGECRYRSQRVQYAKLYRYLISMSLSGVIVTYSRDIQHTAYNICEHFHYFSKQWNNHTSLLEIPKISLPDMRGKPSLVRQWAAAIPDIGTKLSIDAENIFRKPIVLAQSNELDWLRIRGIGVKTAQRIIKAIWGR